jgi:soluble lytic murein transglycosylase-like protein
MFRVVLAAAAAVVLMQPALAQERSRADLDTLIAKHAAANGVPVSLVHRVILRESRYNPRAIGRGGALGLMQIKAATARGVGYGGGANGLLDADTNLTYGVRYLAGAYRVAGGNPNRAVSLYASGYYYHAKRQGLTVQSLGDQPAPAIADSAAAAPTAARAEMIETPEPGPARVRVAHVPGDPLSAVSPANKEFPH